MSDKLAREAAEEIARDCMHGLMRSDGYESYVHFEFSKAETIIQSAISKAVAEKDDELNKLTNDLCNYVKRISDLEAALERAIDAIQSLPEGALGIGGGEHEGATMWYIRDELLSGLRQAAKVGGKGK
jgi:hypothetical protein